MIVWLTLFSALAVVAFAGVLAFYLVGITRSLEEIGGRPTSYLAKIRMGVRAIESETGMLAPQVTRFNQGATALLGGLQGVAADLDTAAANLGAKP
jgi:hypothetical protein